MPHLVPLLIASVVSLALLAIAAADVEPERPANDAPAGSFIDVMQFGAVGDGRADDTAAIQRAVDAQAGGVRLRRGVYRITRPIVIDLDRIGFTSITGDGTATIVMNGPGPALKFIGTHEGTAAPRSVEPNVWDRQRSPVVRGIEIVGSHEQADGIEASGTMQLIISEVTIRRARHGIHLVNRNRNVIVSDCQIYENRGIGVYYDAVNLHQSNIVGCHVSYNRGGGIVVRGGDVRNVHIGTCDIEGNQSPDGEPTANVLFDSTGGSSAEIAITGCTIQHAHEAPGSANIRINGRSTPQAFTNELRHGNVTISGNVLSDVSINIDVQNARGVTIVGNTLWKGFDHNVRVSGSEGIVVAANVLDRNPRYHYGDGADARGGMVFTECDGCTISGNHLSGTGDVPAAIALTGCRRMNVTGCTVLDAARVGLLLEDVSDSRVSGCLVRSDRSGENGGPSLLVKGGRDNQIADNVWANGAKIDDGTPEQ